jgi:hypothetical protein
MDAQRGMQSKFTFDPGDDNAPIWSPDNLRILFQGTSEGSSALRQKRVDGTIKEEVLLTLDSGAAPSDWSASGQYITYSFPQATGGLFATSGLFRSLPIGSHSPLWRRRLTIGTPSSHPTIGLGGSRINRMRAARRRSTSSRFLRRAGNSWCRETAGFSQCGGPTARSCFSCRQTRG